MANLRRHFNFSTKSPTLNQADPNTDMASAMQIDARNLMNNICRCLGVCCSYIQALNSLCGEGSLLARNLLQTFQNVPAYQNVAQQFLCIWDEVGKATAGASAAVKTETLMMLQEVLNVLETGANDNSPNVNLVDSFQVIGSCLFSFVELQAQFSLSTWKSLSKLSKNFSHDTFMNPLHRKSNDRNTLKMSKNSELSSTIKKHYSQLVHKYDTQKSCDFTNEAQSQFYVIPTVLRDNDITSNPSGSQNSVKNTSSSVIWSPATTLWSTSVENESVGCSSVTQKNKTAVNTASVSDQNDLDEVINLLSCMPVGQFFSNDSQSPSNHGPFSSVSSSDYHFWPPGTGPILSRHMTNQRPWLDETSDAPFGYDPWIWRTDNMNCSSLPNGEFKEGERLHDVKGPGHGTSWDNTELQRWSVGENGSSSDDASSTPGQDLQKANQGLNQHLYVPTKSRRYSSSDGLPDAQETAPNEQEYFWSVHNQKTSTWPLKQSSSKLEWPENLVESKYLPLYFTSTS